MSEDFNKTMLDAQRQSTAMNLIIELSKKFSLKNLPEIEEDGKKIQFIPKDIVKEIIMLQETLLRTGLYLTIDWETNSYKAIDFKLGKEYK